MFDLGLILTSQAIRRQLAAMPCELYLVRLIHSLTKRPCPGETDLHPSLPMAGAGLEHHTRFMAVGAHRRQHHGIGLIQVDQDIAGVPILSIRVEVNVAALAIAHPQKTNGRQVRQLCGRPQSLW
jgi:hypothetical protein